MASQGSTSSNQTNWSYDVFLSFRGEDTRDSFTGYLYKALSRRGLNIFLDDGSLKGGDEIKRSRDDAIQQSRSSIVVLSENYASSTGCLDELVEILECMTLKNQLVWPILFKVRPSDVRYQRNSYAEAMAKHEDKFGEGSDKVRKWRSALSEVASLKGWHYETGYEFELIEEIVKEATTKLPREQFDVGEHIIGHQSRIEEVKSLLDIESHQMVCMLGIHGIGGIGKTTLAKALYNSISHQFEYAIFLEDVREKSNRYMGLVHLQEAILSKFEGENVKLSSASEGVTRLKDILQHQRVLLVLDDVDKEDQLENLARKCDWFGLGSRIIITTRDKRVLDLHDVEKRFEMKGLNDDEALQLFCLKAFKGSRPPMDYEKVSKRVVQDASGLPLTLKVIASHLAKKSMKDCEDALKQYEEIMDKKIQEIPKTTDDSLEDPAKSILPDSRKYVEKKLVHLVRIDFSRCQCITHFPDVSGVPNLSELDLSECGNLTAIHPSVGFLQKLKCLDASLCKKLQDFPPRILLPSLQRLALIGTSIALFPHIEDRMCAPLTISLYESPIKELPNSISNLLGLRMILINSKSVTAGGLPVELFMLPNMLMLDLDNCGVAVRQSLKWLLKRTTTRRFAFNKPLYSPLRELHCSNCGLTDEDLDIIFCCLPDLQELWVPGNEFVSLPASIKRSTKLRILDVSDCLMLEEIPELPESICEVHADGCSCLSSEAFKTLWSQVVNEVYGLQVVMPRLTEIPDWFDHHCKGEIVSLWVRRKFPVLAIAFILEEHAWLKSLHLHINGDLCKRSYDPNPNRNVSIFDFRALFFYLEWSSLEAFLVREWNHVEIEIECECECYYDRRCNVNNCNVRSCGVYVYKQETNMEDIRFTGPSSLKRTLSIGDDDSPKRKCSKEAQD